MRRLPLFILAALLICPLSRAAETVLYYSDYFVFIADDGLDPLVIPIDLNWKPTDSGFSTEYKAWYGTRKPWPIAYVTAAHTLPDSTVPSEIWDLPPADEFTFDADAREIVARVPGAPQLRLAVPHETDWAAADTDKPLGLHLLFAARTTAFVASNRRAGWLIYERIRRRPSTTPSSSRGFRRFHWIPLVIDGNLYHFLDNSGDQSASRWRRQDGRVVADRHETFAFAVAATTDDPESGRTGIPRVTRIVDDVWNIDVTLASGANQTGHGPPRPSGPALYRQSLLESTPASRNAATGMLELILDD